MRACLLSFHSTRARFSPNIASTSFFISPLGNQIDNNRYQHSMKRESHFTRLGGPWNIEINFKFKFCVAWMDTFLLQPILSALLRHLPFNTQTLELTRTQIAPELQYSTSNSVEFCSSGIYRIKYSHLRIAEGCWSHFTWDQRMWDERA